MGYLFVPSVYRINITWRHPCFVERSLMSRKITKCLWRNVCDEMFVQVNNQMYFSITSYLVKGMVYLYINNVLVYGFNSLSKLEEIMCMDVNYCIHLINIILSLKFEALCWQTVHISDVYQLIAEHGSCKCSSCAQGIEYKSTVYR